jgi:hypothetical protein
VPSGQGQQTAADFINTKQLALGQYTQGSAAHDWRQLTDSITQRLETKGTRVAEHKDLHSGKKKTVKSFTP